MQLQAGQMDKSSACRSSRVATWSSSAVAPPSRCQPPALAAGASLRLSASTRCAPAPQPLHVDLAEHTGSGGVSCSNPGCAPPAFFCRGVMHHSQQQDLRWSSNAQHVLSCRPLPADGACAHARQGPEGEEHPPAQRRGAAAGGAGPGSGLCTAGHHQGTAALQPFGAG